MSSEKMQRERELFEQYKRQRAPGANLQRIGAEYVDLDVQWHFETWLARATLAHAAPGAPAVQGEPVATILPPDPLDERSGPWLSLEDWARLRALPSGTRLYAAPQPAEQQPAQPDASVLVQALEKIANWADGGSEYGQEKIKAFARSVLAGKGVK